MSQALCHGWLQHALLCALCAPAHGRKVHKAAVMRAPMSSSGIRGLPRAGLLSSVWATSCQARGTPASIQLLLRCMLLAMTLTAAHLL